MKQTLESLRQKIEGAEDLQSVVHTMKAVAADSVGRLEKSILALGQYHRAVELGLGACYRDAANGIFASEETGWPEKSKFDAIVFGSDQGLVGPFNEVVADHAVEVISAMPGKPRVWAVGERVHARLADANLPLLGLFIVPDSLEAVVPLVGRIQVESEAHRADGDLSEVYVFHNRPHAGSLYEPIGQRLLPLDAQWQKGLAGIPWPTRDSPEIMGEGLETLQAIVREYIFISLFQACVESLASENASRLSAMQRADGNIGELLEDLAGTFGRLRQNSIEEKHFDFISILESSNKDDKK